MLLTDNWNKVTYFHTAFKREVYEHTREITFKDGKAYFNRKAVPVELLRKIEPINEEG